MPPLIVELTQNPPASANSRPVDIRGSESGWPLVPVDENSPPEGKPLPLSIVLDTGSKLPPDDWANEKLAAAGKEAAMALMINLRKKNPFQG